MFDIFLEQKRFKIMKFGFLKCASGGEMHVKVIRTQNTINRVLTVATPGRFALRNLISR